MNTKILTFLSIYKFIPSITKSIDRLVEVKSVNSCNVSAFSKLTTYGQANGILELTNKKVFLINLKIVMDKTLLSLPTQISKLLILKFIQGYKCNAIAKAMGFAVRTYYRKQTEALKAYESQFLILLSKYPQLFDAIKQEGWLTSLFDKVEDMLVDNKTLEISTPTLAGVLIKNIKRDVALV